MFQLIKLTTLYHNINLETSHNKTKDLVFSGKTKTKLSFMIMKPMKIHDRFCFVKTSIS